MAILLEAMMKNSCYNLLVPMATELKIEKKNSQFGIRTTKQSINKFDIICR